MQKENIGPDGPELICHFLQINFCTRSIDILCVKSRHSNRLLNSLICVNCGRAPHNSRQECRALGMECYTCHKTEVKHIDMEEESQDCPQSEYTTSIL